MSLPPVRVVLNLILIDSVLILTNPFFFFVFALLSSFICVGVFLVPKLQLWVGNDVRLVQFVNLVFWFVV